MAEHKPVLLHEAVNNLNIKKDSIIVDATLGGGGHSREILQRIGGEGILIGIDVDEAAIENFKKHLKSEGGNVILAKDNFTNLKHILGGQGIKSVDAILADLGYSSLQLEDASYGMSFLQDAPLDMRLDINNELTAGKIVNEYALKDLERILREFGEEKSAKQIARAIGEFRKVAEIKTTQELADIVRQAIPKKFQQGKVHPATKTFQALRIRVNQELENLKNFIPQAIEVLKPGGRLAVISFHSLEDRIVKNIFRENARGCICPPDLPRCACGRKPKLKIITKKPIVPEEKEITDNPRSRSAKLRICEKI